MIKEFLQEIDNSWPYKDKIITLKIIGSTSIFLQSNYTRGTKDTDILEADDITPKISDELIKLAGKESKLCRKHHLYIDIVKKGFLFLPAKPKFLSISTLNNLKHFKIKTLSITDVLISKLQRFNATDIDDINTSINLNLVNHKKFVERFKLALDRFEIDARMEKIEKTIKNFHNVERDMFLVNETHIELSNWLMNM